MCTYVSRIPDTERYINVEGKSVGQRKKTRPIGEKDDKKKENRMGREENGKQFRHTG